MLILDKQKAKNILVTEYGFDPVRADIYLKNYPPIHDELAEAVQKWLEDRSILDVNVYGLTIREIMEIQGGYFLTAVRYLNRLLDSDLTEEERKQMVEDLRKPIIKW